MKSEIRIFIIFMILNFNCTKQINNNISLDIGNGISVSFYIENYQDKTHMRFPSDFGYEPTEECDRFNIDSMQGSKVTICYYPESDTILTKDKLSDLERILFSTINISPNESIILESTNFKKNGVYTAAIKYIDDSLLNAAYFKYYKSKLIRFQFHDFKRRRWRRGC